ncbi:MAG TPA: glycine cleavage system aminomethyltransferase GcvT [Phycisphaerae bacterium]|nr:glycine cleavage system aminomethyltransferase GcvT [Phycisphaerae bacterium]
MSQSTGLLRTCFYDFHVSRGAKMVDFAGWQMPLQYRGIIPEHQHTRTGASIFDVSHMGRLIFSGPDALNFLQHVLTRNLAGTAVGQSHYSLVCNENGGILDDVIVSRYERHFLVVCNASNREKLLAWFAAHKGNYNFTLKDETLQTAMITVQGPKAIRLLDELLPEPASDIKHYHFAAQHYLIAQFSVFRSGYTGEDGVEIICGITAAKLGLNFLFKKGADSSSELLQPAGLGARDTLRLEAGMPLYGNELDEQTDPISAGLGWAVAKDKEFIGSSALSKIREEGPRRRLVGLFVEGPRTARHGTNVTLNGKIVGQVTSGVASPTLGRQIAMAYVDAAHAAAKTPLNVDIRGNSAAAVVTDLPFYRRPQ